MMITTHHVVALLGAALLTGCCATAHCGGPTRSCVDGPHHGFGGHHGGSKHHGDGEHCAKGEHPGGGAHCTKGEAKTCDARPEPLRIDVAQALLANKLEVALCGGGGIVEVEYHADPASMPQLVRDAMEALHPGGPFTDAERELNDGVLYYELSREVGGMEVEAMFTAEGQLHSEEVEVAVASVPAVVRDAVAAHSPAGSVAKWEEIRDGERQLVEYHVKVDVDGARHKLIVTLEGQVVGDFLELLAEIEVPVG